MGSALIDRRTARFAVGLAVAGSLMLTAGLGIWAVSALSHAIPHSAHTLAWLAAVALITAGVCCGVLMIVLLLGSGGNGRSRAAAEPSWPDARGPRPPRPGPGWPAGPPAGSRSASPRPPTRPPAGPQAGPPPQPGPAAPPDPSWLPPDAGPGSAAGPELADWPDPPVPAGHGDRYPAQHWPGPDTGFASQAGPAAGEWAEPAGGFSSGAGEWSGRDDGSAPPAELEPESTAWVVPDRTVAEPGLDLWPAQDPAPPDAEPAAGPTLAGAEQTAEDGELDDGPAHRVESEFNVWQRPGPAVTPDAGPAAPAQDEWVQPDAELPDADLLPEADLLPDADLLPGAELLPAAPELLAEPAEPVAEPLDLMDSQADDELIRRPPAPRRSGPAPGWNPDSEEDWLRVLRGLRSPEDS